jgi:hypothetical protein
LFDIIAPEGNAKAVMLRVRLTPDELRSIKASAKASYGTVSARIRSTLLAAVQT